MALYTLSFTVDTASTTPAEPQFAGVFGDHQAAELQFAVPQQIPADCRFRLEITDGSGGYDITELLESQNGVVTYAVPRAWTAAGTAAVRLIAVTFTKNGEETLCFHSAPAYLFFKEREDGVPMDNVLPAWQEVMTRAETAASRVESAAEIVESAEQARDIASEALATAQTVSGKVDEALDRVEGTNRIYVGSGEMPADCNVQIDPRGDVRDVDYVVERTPFNAEGESYTKWNSGAIDYQSNATVAFHEFTQVRENLYRLNAQIPLPACVKTVCHAHYNTVDADFWAGRCFYSGGFIHVTLWSFREIEDKNIKISLHIQGAWKEVL